MPALLLASSSPYRRELLGRLQLHFSWQSPSIDESRHEDESATDLVKRLEETPSQKHSQRPVVPGGDGKNLAAF